ncbi:hypothetical protein RFI_23092, partial [Reticulomyxa filosa]
PIVLKSIREPSIESQSVFPLDCVTCQFEGDWVGFELQNRWNKPIVLKGWTLTNESTSSALALPTTTLRPTDVIRVCFTEKKKQPQDLVWSDITFEHNKPFEVLVEDEMGFSRSLFKLAVPSNHDLLLFVVCYKLKQKKNNAKNGQFVNLPVLNRKSGQMSFFFAFFSSLKKKCISFCKLHLVVNSVFPPPLKEGVGSEKHPFLLNLNTQKFKFFLCFVFCKKKKNCFNFQQIRFWSTI